MWDYVGGSYAYLSPVVVDGMVYVGFSYPGVLVCFGSLISPTPLIGPINPIEPQYYIVFAFIIPLLIVGALVIWLLLRRQQDICAPNIR